MEVREDRVEEVFREQLWGPMEFGQQEVIYSINK